MAVVCGVPAGLSITDTFSPPSEPITAVFPVVSAWCGQCHKPVVNPEKPLKHPKYPVLGTPSVGQLAILTSTVQFERGVLTVLLKLVIGWVIKTATFSGFRSLFGHFGSKPRPFGTK